MYYTEIKHSSHLRTLEKCRKHSPAARAFYISLVFSNACRVLSQCNTRLRLLYLLRVARQTANDKNETFPVTCLHLLCTVDRKYLYLQRIVEEIFLYLCDLVKNYKKMQTVRVNVHRLPSAVNVMVKFFNALKLIKVIWYTTKSG